MGALAIFAAGLVALCLRCSEAAWSDAKTVNVKYVSQLDGLPELTSLPLCNLLNDNMSTFLKHVSCALGCNDRAALEARFAEVNDTRIAALYNQFKMRTMVRYPRARASLYLLKNALMTAPGDVVETGVWKGGTALMQSTLMRSHDTCDRTFWGFDSWQGLPDVDPHDARGGQRVGGKGHFKTSYDQVLSVFEQEDLRPPRVRLVQGWFKDTLPVAPIKQIAFLRLDGDLYSSTIQALIALYPKVVPGGYVYVDDYGSYNGCREAVDLYRARHRISEPLHWIREKGRPVEGVWWQKRRHTHECCACDTQL